MLLLEEFLRPIEPRDANKQMLGFEVRGGTKTTLERFYAGEEGKDVQVFQVSPREVGVRNDLNLAIPLLTDLHRVAEVVGTIVDLDLIVQEFLERGDVEDLVRGGLGGVDDELFQKQEQQAPLWSEQLPVNVC